MLMINFLYFFQVFKFLISLNVMSFSFCLSFSYLRYLLELKTIRYEMSQSLHFDINKDDKRFAQIKTKSGICKF